MLTPDAFADFVAEVHGGRRPFPWQEALLGRIVKDERWPDVVDVPTGLGKTSVLDIGVFAAALGASGSPRRIFFVVDRRLVVDEAHQHAARLAEALTAPNGRRVLSAVATALRQPGDPGPVLDVTRMRGGVTWDRVWLERPDRFAIVTGTVDQLGSRFLFRGYGVSENSRSIDAALVGTDSLILVDEAHLATALATTVDAALELDEPSAGIALPRPFIVLMSATRASHSSDDARPPVAVHRITVADELHAVAGARLRAPKSLHLVEVKTTKAKAEAEVPEAVAAIAARLVTEGLVGVVVNTVARARAVFERIRERGIDSLLLTGRSRPVDREYLLATNYPRISVDRDRTDRRPFVVVATQTVEVGANVDFDALVTESAPLSSLVQRMGRLNRVAARTDTAALAFVVHDTTVEEKDPVYGPARLATWSWLSTLVEPQRYSKRYDPFDANSRLDVSPLALRALVEGIPEGPAEAVRPEEPYVPVLWPSILDSWVRTSPTPRPDQPVAPFLHGISRPRQPVTLVWRAGLGKDPDTWAQVVDPLPPASDEGLEIDLYTARRWLLRAAVDIAESDIEAAPELDDEARSDAGAPRKALRYGKRGESEIVDPDKLRPGDTLVVPTTYGGCDRYGWHPESSEPVLDVADLARRKRGPALLRVGPTLAAIVSSWHPSVSAVADQLCALAAGESPSQDPAEYALALATLAAALAEEGVDTPLPRVVGTLAHAELRVIPGRQQDEGGRDLDPGYGVLLAAGKAVHALGGVAMLGDDDTEAGSSGARRAIDLDGHQQAVARRAREFAENLGLPEQLVLSVAAAGRWHDEGKRDVRFQTMLHKGDWIRAELAAGRLAKSGMDPADRAAFRRAWLRSGYPVGMRHEALSARIAVARMADLDVGDAQLVAHLVATHHGRGRPLLPPVVDDAPVKVDVEGVGVFDTAETIDWTGPQRFTELNARYGRWGLALLEAIVRLADIWCSAREEES